MNKYRLKQLLAWVLLKKLLIVNAIDVTPLNPKKFDTVILSVNASGHNSIQWDKDTDTLTTCFIGPNVCSTLNNFPGATAAVNAVTVESTITINSANETLHGGYYEATGSTPIDVTVNTLPVTIDWATQPQGNLTSAASAKWTARINCVYPASEVNVHFTVYVEGVKEDSPRSPTLTTVPDSSCDSLEETVVAELTLLSSDIQQIQNQKIYIIANASHASFPNEPSVTSVQSAEAIFQLEDTVSKESKAIEDTLYEIVEHIAKANAPTCTTTGFGSGIIQIYSMVKFTSTVAEKWHFSNRYILCGTVVYGIQIVLVSSVINTVTIAIGVGVLVYYYEQVKCIAILYLFLLAAAFSIVGVSIYMLILIFFGNKDFMHIKCKKREEDKKLSAHGMKLTNDKNTFIYFKVKAIYASITLHIIEHIGSKPNKRQLKGVLPTCRPPQTISNDLLKDSYVLINRNASHTEYQSFYLKCENKTKTITVLDEKYNEIEQWTIIADSFEIGDIEISNTKQDDSTKDDSTNDNSRKDDSTNDNSAKDNSTNDNSTKDNSTENEKEKLDTPEEWICWFREGDTLCEIGEHERKTKENSRCKQTLLLICVIIFPIAWLVMIVLMVRNCIKSKGKNTDNTDSELGVRLNQNKKEPSEQQIEKQNDTKGTWFDFTWFSCFHNSVKPNSTTDSKPKPMPGSYLANSPKGRNLPKLPEIVTQGNEIRKTKKKGKKKKKIKNQDSNMNDKQQSNCDKQDITFQPEIAVAADTLEAE